jgi:hypothetical protein
VKTQNAPLLLLSGLLLLVVAGLIACESDDGEGSGPSSNETTTETSDTPDVVDTQDLAGDILANEAEEETLPVDWGAFDSCTYSGRVVDPSGAPLVGLPVVICSEESPFCGSGKTQDDGTWKVSGLDRIPLGAKVLGALTGMSSVTIPLDTCSQPSTDIGTVTLAPLAAGELVVAAEGGSIAAHPELRLDLPPGLSFPNYEAETEIRAARLDPSTIHPNILAKISPRAVFAIAPYDTEAPSPVAFEASLPELSGAVAVYVLDHLTGHPHKICDSEVVDGLVTCADAGLTELTWVLFE